MTVRLNTRSGFFPLVGEVARTLSVQYGDCSHGNKANPLSELLFILCSLQTNEALYRSTFYSLRRRFRTFVALADATEEAIGKTIVRGGLAKQKARTIHRALCRLKADFGRASLAPLRRMNDSECEHYLESLPGVGRKTARCVMMYSLDRAVFPVDSNCWRVCRRLGWVRATRPDKSCSQRDMDRVQDGVPPSLRFSLHVNFVSHGRTCCLPASPRCGDCCIRSYCKTGRAQDLGDLRDQRLNSARQKYAS